MLKKVAANSYLFYFAFIADLVILEQSKLNMSKPYVVNEEFSGIDFSEKGFPKGEYENCTFRNCIFSGVDLSLVVFLECKFHGCDFSNATLKNTSFKDVAFKSCKLLGLRFDQCASLLLAFSFEDCALNFSSFYKLRIKTIQFKGCQLHEVEFIEADLTNATFENCDLNRATFENTVLDGADFRSAFNFSIDLEINSGKKTRFSSGGLAGLLEKYNIIIE